MEFKAFLAAGKARGLFLMSEGRSLTPSFTNASFCRRNPVTEEVHLLDGLWLSGLRVVAFLQG